MSRLEGAASSPSNEGHRLHQQRQSLCRYGVRGRASSTATRVSDVLAKAALILWLFPGTLVPSQASAHGTIGGTASVLRSAEAPVETRSVDSMRQAYAGAATVFTRHKKKTRRRHHRAAARAVERRLLLIAPRSRFLARFVDRSMGLVKRNVAARCARVWGRHHHRRLPRFICRVWAQPRSPSSGVALVCHTKHSEFRVTAYHRHRSRR